MKLVVDMNLSPEWLPFLRRTGWEVRHWQDIGAATAEDDEILSWAKSYQAVVFTQDLDFVQLLHASGAGGPSVILLRIPDEHDVRFRRSVASIIHQADNELERGVLLTIKEKGARVRDLPLPGPKRSKRIS
jgi:predicted nuclease of predicted toxin-antitoxin system